MRMSRRAGLISGGDANSYRVSISRDSSASSTYPGSYMYVSIDGTNYKSASSTPGPWQLTVEKNTAATAYISIGPQDFGSNTSVVVNYLGQDVLSVRMSGSKSASDSYDFIIDRNLSIVYRLDNKGSGKSYLYIQEA